MPEWSRRPTYRPCPRVAASIYWRCRCGEELLGELEAELASLSDLAKANHTKRVCALRTSPRYGRLLKETKRGLVIDRQAVTELARFDGKFVVHSNDDTLTAEDMALGYKQ